MSTLSDSTIRARYQLEFQDFSLDVDLTLPGRGVTALFGPSGSGKTTLLRLIAGLERTPLGLLEVNNSVWQNATTFMPTHLRPLGYVFQEASLFPHLSAKENVEFGMRRSVARLDRAALDRVLRLLGIENFIHRRPDQLSGGERQRVAIARALAVKPRLLLMDEPLSALDNQRKQEILPYLERLHDELDIPMLYVSHSSEEVARLADHIVLLENGRALAEGRLSEVYARANLPLAQGEDAGVIHDTVVVEHDKNYYLTRLDFPGGGLWVRDAQDLVGRRIRFRILARDVSVTLAHQQDTSIANILPAQVTDISPDRHPAQALVTLDVSGYALIARVTKRSVDQLHLQPGLAVWAQIKAVALLR